MQSAATPQPIFAPVGVPRDIRRRLSFAAVVMTRVGWQRCQCWDMLDEGRGHLRRDIRRLHPVDVDDGRGAPRRQAAGAARWMARVERGPPLRRWWWCRSREERRGGCDGVHRRGMPRCASSGEVRQQCFKGRRGGWTERHCAGLWKYNNGGRVGCLNHV